MVQHTNSAALVSRVWTPPVPSTVSSHPPLWNQMLVTPIEHLWTLCCASVALQWSTLWGSRCTTVNYTEDVCLNFKADSPSPNLNFIDRLASLVPRKQSLVHNGVHFTRETLQPCGTSLSKQYTAGFTSYLLAQSDLALTIHKQCSYLSIQLQEKYYDYTGMG